MQNTSRIHYKPNYTPPYVHGWQAWYWGAEMLGAFVIGRFLDADYRTMRFRALAALGILFFYVNLTW